jgi:23S rRNA (adenine2503-C2)-methyltransferase
MTPSPVPALSGLFPEELRALLSEAEPSLPPFRADQVFRWTARGARSFGDMTDLPRSLRERLEGRFPVRAGEIRNRFPGEEGTEKLQVALSDGGLIEAVLLRDGEGRGTACLSTQAGCPAGCVFCKTGSLGFLRNLSAAEIADQFVLLRSLTAAISRIVVMGMGEPLLNLAELRRALQLLMDPRGCGISKRRITVSTCGIVEGIRELAREGPDVRLALSLTTADADLRGELMPVTRENPLSQVKEALRYYQGKRDRRITLEAVLLGGLNTRREDAAALAAFARGLDAVVNLIPWNPVEGLCFRGQPLREPGEGELAAFEGELQKRGLKVTRRRRKGREVGGACGQLGRLGPVQPG